MLPSRGLPRSISASALRNAGPARTQPARPLRVPIRHFSQARSRSTPLSRICGLSYTPASPISSRTAAGAIASGVFAQRSGASRNLSLWPFSSKQQPPAEAQSASSAVTPAAALETETPAPEDSLTTASSTSAQPDVFPSAPVDSVEFGSAQQQQVSDPFADLEPISILDMPEQIGYLKELGLDFGWGPTSCCEWVLEHVYIYTGMPWWAAIATVAIAWRVVVFWPTLTSSRHNALMQQLTTNPEYIKAKAEFDEATWRTKDRMAQLRAREKMLRLKKESGASTLRSLAGLWTIPFSFGMFRLLRAMAALPVPSLETGGLAWFTDLTVHDPYYILPITSIAITTAMFKQTRDANMTRDAMTEKISKGMMYFLPPVVFIGTAWLPAGIQWFFLVLSAGSVLQTSLTLNPAVRRFANLPPLLPKGSRPAAPAPRIGQWLAPRPPGQNASGTQSVSESAKSLLGVDKQKEAWKKAQDYEERRAMEEKEKALRRMEDLRRKRAEKGGS